MRMQWMVVVLTYIVHLSGAAMPYFTNDAERSVKRSLPQEPEWNQLGWAWGKRSAAVGDVHQRFSRALHPVKKNPDWQDLGFAWGKK